MIVVEVLEIGEETEWWTFIESKDMDLFCE
jgi:hypothetical protein